MSGSGGRLAHGARPAGGLVEAHAHIAAYGQSLELPDVSACGSVAECLDTISREAARAGPGEWIRAAGARIAAWSEARWPTIAELDLAAGGRPCVVMSFDHHAAAASLAALATAGLRAGVAVPPNGVVCVDSSGKATGLLLEQAAYAAWAAAPEPPLEQRERQVRGALQRLAGLGFVEVHDLLSQAWLGPMLSRLQRDGNLPIDVWLYPALREVEGIAAGRAGWESDRVRLAGAKAFADGTINSRTALMLSDYEQPLEEMPRGKAMMSAAELDGALELTTRLGIGLAVHAIGDGAVRMVLDAVESQSTKHKAQSTHRSSDVRIEHAELIDEADVPRFARLGVACSVQPCHLLADIEALRRYLPDRLDRVLPLRELIDSGCRPGGGVGGLWFGSDVPIVGPEPCDSIQAAVQRRRNDMVEADAIGWGQRLSEEEAWAAFGRGGAHRGAGPR